MPHQQEVRPDNYHESRIGYVILCSLKNFREIKDVSSKVTNVTRNKSGDLVLKMPKSACSKTIELCSSITSKLGEATKIEYRGHEIDLELKYFDEVTTKGEIFRFLMQRNSSQYSDVHATIVQRYVYIYC